jgi:hypothetical protein
MSDLNEDGLVPGEPVDFATIQRIERAKSPEQQAEQAKNLQAKTEVRRGRPPKAADAD